jgi:hypothetical protein
MPTGRRSTRCAGCFHRADRLTSVERAPDPAGTADLDDLPPFGARRDRGRTARLVAVGVFGAVLLTALAGGLTELTRTREEHENDDEATSVLLRIDMRGKDMTDQRRVLAVSRQVFKSLR